MEEIKWINLQKVLNDYAVEVRNKYQDKLIDDDKIATGDLLNSVDYIVQTQDTSITVSLRLADYWKWVENGRQAGKFPPVDKIVSWVKNKPILPREDKNGKLPTENQLAYLIGRKIAKEGIKAGNQLRTTIEEINSYYMDKIKEAINEDIKSGLVIIDVTFN